MGWGEIGFLLFSLNSIHDSMKLAKKAKDIYG